MGKSEGRELKTGSSKSNTTIRGESGKQRSESKKERNTFNKEGEEMPPTILGGPPLNPGESLTFLKAVIGLQKDPGVREQDKHQKKTVSGGK